MITLVKLLIVYFTLKLYSRTNPIKIALNLLYIRIIIFFLMTLSTGSTWYPYIISILFIGGILIIFLVLSAIIPNEKDGKDKKVTGYALILAIISLYARRSTNIDLVIPANKWLLSSWSTFIIIIFVLLPYFFSITFLIWGGKTSMRSLV